MASRPLDAWPKLHGAIGSAPTSTSHHQRFDLTTLKEEYQEYERALTEELKSCFASRSGFLYDMLSYHLGWTDRGGNPQVAPLVPHFPSMLALVTGRVRGAQLASTLPVAAAVELIHNFTLVHGDVRSGGMNAAQRPSIWWVWGPSQAINAGDGLHALGRNAIMRLSQRGLEPELVLQAVKALDQACLSLCEGQYMDLSFQDQLLVTEADYLEMNRRKAGALAGCAAQLGALASGADTETCLIFQQAGIDLGMAWQLIRDVNDLWGSEGDGQTVSNVLNKKKSLPIIYALENAQIPVKRELGSIYMKRVLEREDTVRIVEILDGIGARGYAENKASEMAEQALAGVKDILSGDDTEDFRVMADWALGRWEPSAV